MNTATKKKVGTAAAALLLTGALFGASATAASAYPTGKDIVAGFSDTQVGSGDSVKVAVSFLKPGTTATIKIDGKTYTTGAASKAGVGSISIKVPKDAGVYTVTIAAKGEDTVSKTVTVGTIVKNLTATVPSSAKRGKSFTISGKLTATVPTMSKKGAPVEITYKVGNTTFSFTVKTAADGSYSKSLRISKTGKYKITAEIPDGTDFTGKGSSDTIAIKR